MAATTARKKHLSASTDGRGIKIVATATAGTALHTATATADGSQRDEIYVYLYNSHTDDVEVTFEYGGVTDPDDHIVVTVPFDSGLILAIPGLTLENALALAAFASVANVVVAYGFVNPISQDID